jgi:hypothetical protein
MIPRFSSTARSTVDDEVSVKKTAPLSLLILMMLVVVCTACHRGNKTATQTSTGTTETIAPVAGQPAANGTDAVTQTVDVEDGRSEDDGGVLTSPQTAKTPPAPKPAATKKHR